MSTTDSPWDDSADLPDWHYASIYGPEAELARQFARLDAIERRTARLLAALRDPPAPQRP